MDLTSYVEIQEPTKTKIILTCYLWLDKKTMIEALMHEQISIKGKHYKVPEAALLECLINKRFGETRLDFEEVG